MVTKAELDRAMAEIYTKFEEFRTENADRFREERDHLEQRLTTEANRARVEAEKNRSDLLQGVCQQIKAAQDINIASHLDLQAQLANVLSRLDQ
jgi:hypothetical protein